MAESLAALGQSVETPSQQLSTTNYRPIPTSASYSNSDNHGRNSNIHTTTSIRSNPGSGTRLAANTRTPVVIQTHELYVRLPSKQITSEQLFQFIKIQFGVNVVVRYMNTKHQSNQITERNFCLIECDSKEDMEWLIDEMNDATIGDWEDPIIVKQKTRSSNLWLEFILPSSLDHLLFVVIIFGLPSHNNLRT
jgi:hypothetical protein